MLPLLALFGIPSAPVLKGDGLHGYINARLETPPPEYGYGVSLYSSAWPLLKSPVAGFQIGLASTWILPDNRSFKEPLVPHGTVARDSMPERGPSFWTVFQTIEGGLGFWTSNRYFSPTAKFRMNGSVDGYNHELSTPGWDFYGNPLPAEHMGIVQLSPRLLFPPDGLTLKPDTCGELFGYAWMALPLLAARETPVRTGNQCWTAFFNAANFRGPVAFYLPTAWSRMSQTHPPAVGRGLDALPGIADSGAIEIGAVPRFQSAEIGDASYSRIPSLQFPVDRDGHTLLFHNFTVYNKSALWNQVESWVQGRAPATGRFDAQGAFMPRVTANPLVVQQGSEVRNMDRWVATAALDDHTFGLTWPKRERSPWKSGARKGEFPAYFRQTGSTVEAIPETEVSDATGLKSARFAPPDRTGTYRPSDGGQGVWTHPGPTAGPFRAKLSDGSIVTYAWYRFIDQPSLQSVGLSESAKARLQRLLETMHATWTPQREYMAPPLRGRLAAIDPALLVHPPKGLERGYVPIPLRQDPQ